jgi:hypothetical protein
VERVLERVQRLGVVLSAAAEAARAHFRILFLQRARVAQHDAGELARRRGRDHLASKAALDQQRNAAAVIEMRVRQQHEIDRGGIEAELGGIALLHRIAALEQAAIDEDALAAAFEQMARAGDLARGSVAGQRDHGALCSCVVRLGGRYVFRPAPA